LTLDDLLGTPTIDVGSRTEHLEQLHLNPPAAWPGEWDRDE
jgi:hypothetical protein